jgi:glycosyltransferase involved in cell wall biosynthesis
MNRPFLSICIPTLRRWSFLQQTLPLYLQRPEVGEVIVTDETGEDVAEIQKQSWASHAKLRLFVNPVKKGIYANKRYAATLATFPYVAVLDSDNLFDEEWFEDIADAVQSSTEQRIYGSAAFKSVDIDTGEVQYHCKQFDGLLLTPANWNRCLGMPKWNFLLNDGNWVIPNEAIQYWTDEISPEYIPGAKFCDALYTLRLFIKAGYSIYYVPGLCYTHTVHRGSSWLLTDRESTRAMNTTDWRI